MGDLQPIVVLEMIGAATMAVLGLWLLLRAGRR